MKTQSVLYLTGMPGAGKSTLAATLETIYRCPRLEVGQIGRELAVDARHPLSADITHFQSQRIPFPEWLLDTLLANRFKTLAPANPVIVLVGVPRNEAGLTIVRKLGVDRRERCSFTWTWKR